MRHVLTHKGYEVFATTAGANILACIKEPRRKVIIAEVPAVPVARGDLALKPLAKAAIERDILTRR